MDNATILLVEDDATLAMNLQSMLALMGYAVAGPLATGEEVIAFLTAHQVDLVLMDIELAGAINGIKAAETITRTSDCPIVFLTGFSHAPLLKEAKAAAPYAYLIKPVQERELAAALEMALHRNMLDRQLKTSQLALARSVAKYRHFFTNSPLGIFRTTLDGLVVEVNDEMARIVGCSSPEEVISDCFDLAQQFYVDPGQRRDFLALLQKNEVVQQFECETKKKNGEHIWVSINAKLTPAETDNGQGSQMVIDGFVVDITERKRAQEALRESEQNFRTLSNSGQALIWTAGTDKGCNYFNDVWLAFTGRTLEQERGEGWTAGVHPDDRQRCLDIYLQAFDRREKFSMEYRLCRYDGQYRWILDDGCPRFDCEGQFIGYIGHCLDITERKQAEDEIQRNESRLRRLVDILQHPAETIQELLDYVLEQAIQLTGSKIGYIYHYHEERQELTLNSWSREVLPACAVANPQACYHLTQTGIWGEAVRQRRPLVINDFSATHPLKKGYPKGHVPLQRFVTIPIFKGERIVSVVGLANKETDYEETDILQITLLMDAVWKMTDSMRAEEETLKLEAQLLQAQKMEAIGTLAGGIAHDFNNVLGAILGFTEIACDAIPPESIAHEYLAKVLEASHRASNLVKQILVFSRQANSEQVALQPALIIREAIKLLRPSLPTTITIKQQIAPDTKAILADPTQVHQILMNLCTNAFHAMEQTGGTLTITLKNVELTPQDLQNQLGVQPGSFALLSVADSGTGIPFTIREKIFDPYFTTKEVGKGTGMGLAIVHGIVKKYGGFISCASNPGLGTVFQVYIPAIEAQSLTPSQETTESIAPGRERILFVDDEEILADVGKTMLERLGYEVTVRTSSLEAWATFLEQPDQFDAVITDQTMPGLTGTALALRMLQLRPDLPIILCTGYSSLISEEEARSLGIRGFAMKPLAKKDVASILRTVLDA